MQNSRAALPYCISVFLGALLIMTPSLNNNFPFLYADTGTYIMIGWGGGYSDIRPMLYGLFMRHVSLDESLWLVILVQSLIVSHVIHQFLFKLLHVSSTWIPLLCITCLLLFTSIGITTGMLMPDFMTAVMILATLLLCLSAGSVLEKGIYSLLILFALGAHHSNSLILLLSFILLALYRFSRPKDFPKIPFRTYLSIISLFLVGHFITPSLHYLRSGDFYRTHSRNIFLAGRFHQMSLLEKFLEENCDDKNYTLCDWKGRLPDSFIWDENGPVQKASSWREIDKELAPVVSDMLHSPLYLKKLAIKSVETSVQQFFTFETVVIVSENENGYPYHEFKRHLPEQISMLRNARQYKSQWSNNKLDERQKILAFPSLLFLFFLSFKSTNPGIPNLRFLIHSVALFLIANAVICGGVSMIAARFQSRVIWIIPLFALAILFSEASKYLNSMDSINKNPNPSLP
jgi:hypothetical protein